MTITIDDLITRIVNAHAVIVYAITNGEPWLKHNDEFQAAIVDLRQFLDEERVGEQRRTVARLRDFAAGRGGIPSCLRQVPFAAMAAIADWLETQIIEGTRQAKISQMDANLGVLPLTREAVEAADAATISDLRDITALDPARDRPEDFVVENGQRWRPTSGYRLRQNSIGDYRLQRLWMCCDDPAKAPQWRYVP